MNNVHIKLTYISLSVKPLPVAGQIVGNTTLCLSDTFAVFSDTLFTSHIGTTWTTSDPSAIAFSSIVATDTTHDVGKFQMFLSGAATLYYSVTSPDGCGTATDSLVVNINPRADAGRISGSDSICANTSLPVSGLITTLRSFCGPPILFGFFDD